MMSSVLQQKGVLPRLVFSVAYPRNNGSPETEDVCKFFRGKGLEIRELPYDGMEVIQFRGLARNRQLSECDCEWILFSDSDMVYAEDFFDDLGRQLTSDLSAETRCISSSRISLDKDHCKRFFNELDEHTYPSVIENPSALVSTWPVFQISRSCGAGYFQLANTRCVREKTGGLYVDETSCNDWSWQKMQKAKSDGQFRRRLGGVKRIKTKAQYHLNHERDNEVGYHLTLQR